jgi:hypothetical protein
MSVTVLSGEETVSLTDAREEGANLWASASDLEKATGWTVKPEGLCREHACVPLPSDGSWRDQRGNINVTAFMEHLGQPTVGDLDHSVWVIGSSAARRRDDVLSLTAPDFTLPDIDGNLHSLSQYRGKKVFLYTFGSYCGCKFDPPAWQVVYDELKDQGLMIISVALDTAGNAAVRSAIRPTRAELDARTIEHQQLMGWGEHEWSRQSVPEYPCLVDTEHVVADLFGMTNVPMAVWIDEQGTIVRPTEAAAFGDDFRAMDRETFALPADKAARLVRQRDRYIDALRDWVAKGADSEFALDADEVRRRTHPPRDRDIRAAAHVKLGRYLYEAGHVASAKSQFEEAVRLCPEKWNYRRQKMSLDPEYVGELNVLPEFWNAMDALGDKHYYPPIQMSGIND